MLLDEGIFQLPLHHGLECSGEIDQLLIEREAFELLMREQADCQNFLFFLHWTEKFIQPATTPVVAAFLRPVERSLLVLVTNQSGTLRDSQVFDFKSLLGENARPFRRAAN